MTGQEWEDKFRKEHGRVARREEYRAAAARNFEPEEAPVVAPAPKAVAKKSSGKSKRALFLLLAVVVAIVAGAMTYKLTHSKYDNGTAKVASSAKSVSKAATNKASSAVSSPSSSSSSSSSTKASDFSGSTPGVVATDLSRTDRAKIIAQVVMSGYNKPATDVNGITAGTVGGVGSGKGSLHLGVGVNGIGVQYSLIGDGGVSQITGRYSGGNGDGMHDFSIDVNDWLANHDLNAVRQAFGDVTVTDQNVSAMGD
ncbi:hypothetical protein [Weissella confusa]|uniref:hypothetical protein n=1 Tax=Weissella confusa TaxID=1583 RepID=UPI00223BCCF8|nr:hypothetical protein [Weissella confusa]MCT0006421.1 hypothetical protein [Weissella confusa]MCT0019158.1 hypothetical protein [Weissella confusa]